MTCGRRMPCHAVVCHAVRAAHAVVACHAVAACHAVLACNAMHRIMCGGGAPCDAGGRGARAQALGRQLGEERQRLQMFLLRARREAEDRRETTDRAAERCSEYFEPVPGESCGPAGRFEVLGELGKGVFATVYRCRDVETGMDWVRPGGPLDLGVGPRSIRNRLGVDLVSFWSTGSRILWWHSRCCFERHVWGLGLGVQCCAPATECMTTSSGYSLTVGQASSGSRGGHVDMLHD